MQKLHLKFMQGSKAYAKWHGYAFHGAVHFFVLIVTGVAVTTLLVGSINSSTAYGQTFNKNNRRGVPQYSWSQSNDIAQQILEVNLSYDQNAQPALVIKSLRRKNGFAPLYKNIGTGLLLQVLDKDNQILKSVPFDIPNKYEEPLPLPGDTHHGQSLSLKKINFTLTLEWIPTATTVQVVNTKGVVMASKDVKNIPIIQNKPNYRTLPGSKARELQDNTSSFLERFTTKALAQTSQNTLDITFIGDKYTTSDLDKFHNDVNTFIASILSMEPFKSRASQIVFHYVDNTSDLGCAYDTTITRLITCNNSSVSQAVTNSGVPADKIIVIVNSDVYGGSGGPIAVSYDGGYGPLVVVHEFGHSIGNLLDEYNLWTTDGGIDNYTDANCYAGTPPDPDWSGIVALSDYARGCNFPNWYRSSPGSIMLSLDYPYFNAVSIRLLNTGINFYTGTVTDTTPPVISNIASSNISPTGATISWSTNESSDSQVEYGHTLSYGQTTLLNPSMVTSHTVALTSLSSSLLYHYHVKSRDAAGNLATSADQTFTTTAPPDTTPPTVSISAPTNGATVSGATSVTATASDNVGVVGVQFKLDGTNLGSEDTTSPYSYSWDTTTASNGSHTLSAVARDAAGNTTTSTSVPVTVNNPVPDTTAPSVPTNLSATASSPSVINLSWTASTDNVGVTGYQIYRCLGASCSATTQISTSLTNSFSNTGLTASTAYGYRIKAYDAAGNPSDYSSPASATTQAPPDTTPPTVSISAPTNGATVSGATSVTATASDNVGVVGVQFKLDGTNLGSEDTTSPYSYSWDTTTASNGSHTLSAVARDAAGNTTTSTSVPVTVNNPVPDTTAPSVPTNLSATASSPSVINLSWTASTDNVGVTGYQIYRCLGASCSATTQISTSLTNSFSNTGLTASTAYGYRIKAYDAAGNPSDYSSPASATTQAPPDTTPPTVSISAPTNGATVSGLTNVGISASDNSGSVTKVELYKDGALINTATVSPFNFSWDTSAEANGSHTLQAKAYDAAGNVGNSPQISVTVTVQGSGSPKVGDLNNDGVVDIFDYNTLVGNFGKTGVGVAEGDINGDGKVDIYDYNLLVENFGK